MCRVAKPSLYRSSSDNNEVAYVCYLDTGPLMIVTLTLTTTKKTVVSFFRTDMSKTHVDLGRDLTKSLDVFWNDIGPRYHFWEGERTITTGIVTGFTIMGITSKHENLKTLHFCYLWKLKSIWSSFEKVTTKVCWNNLVLFESIISVAQCGLPYTLFDLCLLFCSDIWSA